MSDTPETDAAVIASGGDWSPVLRAVAQRLERERDEAQKELSSIHRWIERNHADGFIDSLTYLKNLERVTDSWYDRLDKMERERDEARAAAKLAYSILAKVNRPSLEAAAARSSIKHINNTPMEWLYSIIQNWKEGK
jgi:hypothetical protein